MKKQTNYKKLHAVLDDNLKLNMGPQHPSTHGVMRLELELNGEKIISVKPDIGYLHRGVEKLIEDKTFKQVTPYFDRFDYLSPMICEHVWCLSVEKTLGLEVPKRAQYIRVMFAELNRISSHLLWLGTHALDLGAMSVFLYTMESREKILNFYQQISGDRMHTNYFRVGGVAKDISDDLILQIREFVEQEQDMRKEYDRLLTNNTLWKNRTIGIGVISAKDAVEKGFSGPMLRGSGVAWDLRKAQPYEIYEELDFDIPVGQNGDCYSRYLVRLEEIQQSLQLVLQCLDQMPKGIIRNPEYEVMTQTKKVLNQDMASLINHYQYHTEGEKPAESQFYTCVESSRGELGVYLVTDGSNKPYRCKVKKSKLYALAGNRFLAKGHTLPDLTAIIGSLDVVFGEIDR